MPEYPIQIKERVRDVRHRLAENVISEGGWSSLTDALANEQMCQMMLAQPSLTDDEAKRAFERAMSAGNNDAAQLIFLVVEAREMAEAYIQQRSAIWNIALNSAGGVGAGERVADAITELLDRFVGWQP